MCFYSIVYNACGHRGEVDYRPCQAKQEHGFSWPPVCQTQEKIRELPGKCDNCLGKFEAELEDVHEARRQQLRQRRKGMRVPLNLDERNEHGINHPKIKAGLKETPLSGMSERRNEDGSLEVGAQRKPPAAKGAVPPVIPARTGSKGCLISNQAIPKLRSADVEHRLKLVNRSSHLRADYLAQEKPLPALPKRESQIKRKPLPPSAQLTPAAAEIEALTPSGRRVQTTSKDLVTRLRANTVAAKQEAELFIPTQKPSTCHVDEVLDTDMPVCLIAGYNKEALSSSSANLARLSGQFDSTSLAGGGKESSKKQDQQPYRAYTSLNFKGGAMQEQPYRDVPFGMAAAMHKSGRANQDEGPLPKVRTVSPMHFEGTVLDDVLSFAARIRAAM